MGQGDFMDPFLICNSTYATRGTLSPVHLMLQSHNNNSLIEIMLLRASLCFPCDF
jgi:hypothetical protein